MQSYFNFFLWKAWMADACLIVWRKKWQTWQGFEPRPFEFLGRYANYWAIWGLYLNLTVTQYIKHSNLNVMHIYKFLCVSLPLVVIFNANFRKINLLFCRCVNWDKYICIYTVQKLWGLQTSPAGFPLELQFCNWVYNSTMYIYTLRLHVVIRGKII